MKKKRIINLVTIGCFALVSACGITQQAQRTENKNTPGSFGTSTDTVTAAQTPWKQFFTDPNLVALIDSALVNNQELNVLLQEMKISKNEVMARKGEYLPMLDAVAGAGADKVGLYTSQGSNDANTDIRPGERVPEVLTDYYFGAVASWEVDIWKKLRNAKISAFLRYLSSVEGKNFMVTHLVSEIAQTYYELLALDNQLVILKRNIQLQKDALEIVKLEKQSARVTELAVKRFEAQVLRTQSLQYDIQQQIVEAENRINFLVGRFPQPVVRTTQEILSLSPDTLQTGIPAQLLANRPDIRQAELELEACKLDVKSARANFYPSLHLNAGIGFRAFQPGLLLQAPESMIYSLVGDLAAPLINRNAIKAMYYNANAKQIQAVYAYEQSILNAYVEVVNQMAKVKNLAQSFELKSKQVDALNESVTISNKLFRSARADYMEVLLTQREALESKFELVETRKEQMQTLVELYQSLGGGWR